MSVEAECEYIVVGSGAGGGTLAARLAEAGKTVVLLEAGQDAKAEAVAGAVGPGNDRLPEDYDVPVFHAFASENDAMKWDFFVRHYADAKLQEADPKYQAAQQGVLYPRAGTLGGCTAHNAMIFVYPHDADWNYIAKLTGDESWSATRMRTFFERLENCHHRPLHRFLSWFGINPSRHGFSGWLHTQKAIPMLSLKNTALFRVIADAAKEAITDIGELRERLRWLVESQLDPNDWRTVKDNSVGMRVSAADNSQARADRGAGACGRSISTTAGQASGAARGAGDAGSGSTKTTKRLASNISKAGLFIARTRVLPHRLACCGVCMPRAESHPVRRSVQYAASC